jgi:cobalt-zinc-cadmium efflux system membrane fusion protein
MTMHYKSDTWNAHKECFAACGTILAIALVLAGCGGAGDQASKMTSYAESPESKAELFTLPPEQMAHIQIYRVAKAPLERTLRLPGAVAYNSFHTAPVISQVGGPVSRVMVVPGEHVRAGQPLLYVSSPDYSMLRSAYMKARDAFQLADRVYKRDQDLLVHKAIAQADLDQAESARAQAEADLQSSEQALRVLGTDPEKMASSAPSSEVPLLALQAGEIVERLVSPGQLLQNRHRLGHAETIRDRHCRRTDFAAAAGILRQSGVVRNGGEAGRRAASLTKHRRDVDVNDWAW